MVILDCEICKKQIIDHISQPSKKQETWNNC